MAYLINTARPSSLLIGGGEYIDNLKSFQVSDSSSYRNGIVTTTGTIVIGSAGSAVLANGIAFEDYQRNDFKRGTDILFAITYPSGNTQTHPRGRLKVISSTYSPETEEITIEVGCGLVMAKLLDDDGVVLSHEEIPLDETAKTFEGISSSLATAGKLIWQNNSGSIEKVGYFDGDSYGTYKSGDFVSVRGVTALAVQPLAATAAIPDVLELSYQYPGDQKAQDNLGKVDTTTTESNYFIKYPATVFERIKGATVDMKVITSGGVITIPAVRGPNLPSTGCGSTPSAPFYRPSVQVPVPGQEKTVQIPAPCSKGYETKAVPQFIPAVRNETRQTFYNGPAAQTSLTRTEVFGPALELNSGYWADKFAYCGATYANECLPSPCPMFGTETVQLGKQETQYFYGTASEVVKTVTTTWRPRLAAAQPDDWRSGTRNGVAQDFDQDFGDKYKASLYKHQVVVREFRKEDNANVQETTTFTSSVSRGGGLNGNIGAYGGIKTSEIRRSVSSVAAEIRPDSVNAATTQVETGTTLVQMHGQVGGYVNNAGPYTQKEDTPVPLLFDSKGQVESAVNTYGDYLARFIEGDARGLQIGEALREQIGTNWKPNMPFRYYDPREDQLMAFRADACSWGADADGCVVVMNGIWIATMSGSVTIPDNLEGNAAPDMTGGDPAPLPPPPVSDPGVIGDSPTNKRFNFHVSVYLTSQMLCNPSGADGIRVPPPGPQDVTVGTTLVAYCRGYIAQPGALIALENDGSLPMETGVELLVDESLIIVDDSVMFPDIVNP
jgi:hypothetical protein